MLVAPGWIAIIFVMIIIVLYYGISATFIKRESNENLQLGNRIGCIFSTIIIIVILFGLIYLLI